jgi:hypothetical protein
MNGGSNETGIVADIDSSNGSNASDGFRFRQGIGGLLQL